MDKYLILLPGISMTILLLYLFLERRKMGRRIEELTDYLVKVQDRNCLPAIGEQAEGKLKILQSEIYKLSCLLQEQYASEAEKNQYLADMISNISHQIKTPLTAITIMTDLIKSEQLSREEQQQCVLRITQQTDRITWLVQTLLTIARLDAGVLLLKEEWVDLEELLSGVFETLAVLADVKGIDLKKEVPKGTQVSCDVHWMSEAILNIVKNCLEHTPEGGSVRINVKQSNVATDIFIRDTGTGIAKENLPYVFDRFYSGKKPDAGGIGIGLALSKQIIVNQNGTISVQSKAGQGTEFLIRLYRTKTL